MQNRLGRVRCTHEITRAARRAQGNLIRQTNPSRRAMSFSEHFLGKPIGALDFVADIEPFVRKEEPESQNLEYKSLGGRRIINKKVISAFLHAGVSRLIIGAA